MVRSGAHAARVQARFDAPAAIDGGWVEDGEVVLARSVGRRRAEHRSDRRTARARVLARRARRRNSSRSTASTRGSDSSRPRRRRAFVDRFAGADHLSAVDELRDEHEVLRGARSRARRARDARARPGTRDGPARLPGPGDRGGGAAAGRDRDVATRRGAARARGAPARAGLGGGARTRCRRRRFGRAANGIGRAAVGGASWIPTLRSSRPGRATWLPAPRELAREVREYRERLELDPARLQEVRERIAALSALQRKYGEGEREVLAFLERARERARPAGRLGRGAEQARTARSNAAPSGSTALAVAISDGRARASVGLGAALQDELRELGMAGAGDRGHARPERDHHVRRRRTRGAPSSRGERANPRSRSRRWHRAVSCRERCSPAGASSWISTTSRRSSSTRSTPGSAARPGWRSAGGSRGSPSTARSSSSRTCRRSRRSRTGTSASRRSAAPRPWTCWTTRRASTSSRGCSPGLPESDAAAAHAEELLVEAGRAKRGAHEGPSIGHRAGGSLAARSERRLPLARRDPGACGRRRAARGRRRDRGRSSHVRNEVEEPAPAAPPPAEAPGRRRPRRSPDEAARAACAAGRRSR